MTTPNERARSLIWAGGFLIELARDKRLPLDVRRSAVVIARHFPTAGDISFAASQSPSFGLDLELESPGAIAAWAKDCPQGLLRESTSLAWPEEDQMPRVVGSPLDALLESARAASSPADIADAEQAFYKALMEATVYAHVPTEPAPPDRIRFIQFVRPDNGQTVLPFFSDRDQAEVAAAGKVAIMAMAGRRLFELTRGATLMLNPNRDQLTFYPPELGSLLEDRPLGVFTQETLKAEEQVGACPPSVPTDALVLALRGLYEHEPSVRAGYLVEVHRGPDHSDVFLLLTLVVTKGNDERVVQLTTLELSSVSRQLELPVTMTCVLPDAPLPELCHHGIQFYGT